MLFYCKRCFYPHTKPDLVFNAKGICNACTAFESRATIDWEKRKQEFQVLVDYYKSLRAPYDCVIPVSGGKDSTYQVIRALEYGLRPLAVTATTDDLSSIGRRNLDNIAAIGVDHIEVTVNKQLRRKINAYTLEEIGDISWAEHITIFTIPVRIAVQMAIPLIIWGENPQNEYGGPEQAQKATKLDQKWLEEYGGLNGLRVSDLYDVKEFSSYSRLDRELLQYTYPDLTQRTTNGIFLGQFFPWDGAENALIASKHGFSCWIGPVEGSGYSYENLDNQQTGIHDYFKYLKFGFGRATDIVSNHIRRGNISRSEGKAIILEHDGRYPSTYLGVSLSDTIEKIGISTEKFSEIVNRWANKDLFEVRKGRIPKPLFKGALRDA